MPGARRRISAIILYGSFARGDFHEGSDIVGDFRERPHRPPDRTALLH
ncbi:nucleotidyltransferase domain-containing protein [Methanoculleus bourgensis]|nr:nucleotidyltransferase domain-containing protein [Methanoculleus bourgensis]